MIDVSRPEFLVDRLITLAMYYVECVEGDVGANTKACDALLHPGLKRPPSNWSRVKALVRAAPKTPLTAVATWIAAEWFADQCAGANVSLGDVASACEPIEREFAAERVTDAETLRTRAFVRAVRYLNVRRRAGLGADTGALEDFIPDDFVPVGKGEGRTGYREHVVPRLLLRDRCNEMLETGAKVERVAAWLRDYLVVVKITGVQAEALDHTYRWKTCMPPGWQFGSGCIYERLHRAG